MFTCVYNHVVYVYICACWPVYVFCLYCTYYESAAINLPCRYRGPAIAKPNVPDNSVQTHIYHNHINNLETRVHPTVLNCVVYLGIDRVACMQAAVRSYWCFIK